MINEYVTCAVCGGRFRGKVPKGGDGSVLFPRKHKRRIGDPRFIGGGHVVMKSNWAVCDGSYREAKEYEQNKL